ncbi:MAG: hypothetical protein IJU55_02295 [Selenomonadaceae bacterium]|nr:hypothetical protein [Selenomonadaceae bacterium]
MIPKSADEITDEERRKFFGLKDGEDDNDPFYSKENLLRLMRSIEQLKNGQVVVVPFEKLKEMLNG